MLMSGDSKVSKNTMIDGRTLLCKYIVIGKSERIVQMLATKENIDLNDNSSHIIAQFGTLFFEDLIRRMNNESDPLPINMGNLVDMTGKIICKDPAEIALAVFSDNNILQQHEIKYIFIQPCKKTVINMSGEKIYKEFVHGIHIQVPIIPENNHKIRYHMLSIYDNNMLVRFISS
jgi:hypothetical protein